MSDPIKKGSNKNLFLRIINVIVAIIVGVYIIPNAKHTLFPDQVTRVEKMLRRSIMNGYQLAVDRQDDLTIILTAYNGGRSITTEIYRNVIREIEPHDGIRVFFTYSINDNAQKISYLTRTKIEADADLKQVRRLELSVCGRLADQHAGVTRFDGYEPVYECEVPVQQVICNAAATPK